MVLFTYIIHQNAIVLKIFLTLILDRHPGRKFTKFEEVSDYEATDDVVGGSCSFTFHSVQCAPSKDGSLRYRGLCYRSLCSARNITGRLHRNMVLCI